MSASGSADVSMRQRAELEGVIKSEIGRRPGISLDEYCEELSIREHPETVVNAALWRLVATNTLRIEQPGMRLSIAHQDSTE